MKILGIVSVVTQETTKQGAAYCKVQVLTPSKQLINVWGCNKSMIKLKSLFVADVKSNDQGLSCSFTDIQFGKPTEEQLKWIPVPPTKDEWRQVIESLIVKMNGQSACEKQITFFKNQALKLYNAYCVFPAGKSNHHAYAGGLARHTFEILRMYNAIFDVLPYITNVFVTATASLFHDAAKVRCYNPESFEYTQYGTMVNHVAGSASMCSELMREDGFDETIIMYVEHCILAHHELLEYGSPVKPACVEALVLAMLDRISGHGTQMAENATILGTKTSNLGTIFKLDL